MAKSGTLLKPGSAACFIASCLIHALVLLYVLGPYVDVAMQREEMVLQLEEEQKREASGKEAERGEMAMKMTGRVSRGKAASDKSSSGDEPGELPEHVDFAPEDEDKEKIPRAIEGERQERILRRVRRSIASVWNKAEPPCSGIVELRLKLAPNGELMSLWITRLKGRSELGDYLRGLLGNAAPYSGAMHNATRPVVFDCRFEISGPGEKRSKQ